MTARTPIEEQIGSILGLIDATRCGRRLKPAEISVELDKWYDALDSLSWLREHSATVKANMARVEPGNPGSVEITDHEALGAILHGAIRARETGGAE